MLISQICFKVYVDLNYCSRMFPDLLILHERKWGLLHLNYTPVVLVSIQLLFTHCLKYAEIRAFSDPYFPLVWQNLCFCPNAGKYGYDSVHIPGNMDQRKHVFRHISRNVLLNIFSHNLIADSGNTCLLISLRQLL